MAYQTKERSPLLDSSMSAALEKRSKEVIGLAFVVIAAVSAMIIGSYAPTDPSWLSATDAPVQNWMGQTGASIAAPTMMIVGKAAWVVAATALVWAMRFAMHKGADRVLTRLIFLPIAIAICAVYAASLVPPVTWTHAFGLGGLFGDTVLAALMQILPMQAGAALKILSLLLAVGTVAIIGFVFGLTMPEVKEGLRFMALGLVMTYVFAMRLIGRGASGAMSAAGAMQARQAERKEAQRLEAEALAARRMAEEPQLTDMPVAQPAMAQPMMHLVPDPVTEDVIEPEPVKEKTGLLARMPALIKRPEPTPEPQPQAAPLNYDELPQDARIQSKISDVIKSRARHNPHMQQAAMQQANVAPLTKGRGHGPNPMILDTSAPRVEPPLTAGMPAADAMAAAPIAAPMATATLVPDPMPDTGAHTGGLSFTSARMVRPEETNIPESPVPTPEVQHHVAQDFAPQTSAASAPVSMHPEAVPHEMMSYPSVAPAPEWLRTAPQTQAAPAPAPLQESAPTDALPLPTSSRVAPATMPEAVLEPMSVPIEDDTPSFASAPQPAPEKIAAFTGEPAMIPEAAPKRVVQPVTRKPMQPSTRAKAEAQPRLQFEDATSTDFELPPLNLLESPINVQRHHLSDDALEENARMLESVLDDYGVKGEIVSVRPGPVVTMYELEPAPGLKASRVIGLADDIARSMSALSARVSTVPGRSVIGIELPNENREKVVLREILSSRDFGDGNQKLPLALGKDIGGDPVVANLAKMPHLLIAGTTGSGKSVAINTMILSLLYKLTPSECRLIMIDPKMLELSVYDGIPHLLSPVVTDPKKAVVALKWVVGEMEERYRKMSKMGVRNIDGYNSRVADAQSRDEMFSRTVQTGFDDETGEPTFETEEFAPEKMPYIVVIVDEMADLMMVAGKEIEACIQRLAQMARASGIHLIMATQRPSVDVITGTIKANFPTRISFQVTSKIDSRTILGEMGAEQLLGMGDMLYMAGGAKITRCHGPFVSDEEVEEIVNHLKAFGPPDYMSGVVEGPDEDKVGGIDAVLGLSTGGNTDGEDALYDQAVAIVIKDRKCSTSYIQRKLAIGYNKAARLVEQMETEGLVSQANHVGKREILVPEQ